MALDAGLALGAGFAFVAALALPDGIGTRFAVVGDFVDVVVLGFATAGALSLVLEAGFLASPTMA